MQSGERVQIRLGQNSPKQTPDERWREEEEKVAFPALSPLRFLKAFEHRIS